MFLYLAVGFVVTCVVAKLSPGDFKDASSTILIFLIWPIWIVLGPLLLLGGWRQWRDKDEG
jgi:hypothetical protein